MPHPYFFSEGGGSIYTVYIPAARLYEKTSVFAGRRERIVLDDRTTRAFGSWQISCLVRLWSRVFQFYLFVSYGPHSVIFGCSFMKGFQKYNFYGGSSPLGRAPEP